MEAENPLCSSCTSIPATMFCLCDPQPVLLCTNCFPSHFTKTPSRIHHPYPIQAYSSRSIPGYFSRLEKRSSAIPPACQELRKNVTTVDECVSELGRRADALISAIREYVQTETDKLQRLKAQLQREVDEAVGEVERTLYEDDPGLRSKYGPILRTCGEDLSQLSLFSYQVTDSLHNLPAVLKLTDTSGTLATDPAPVIPLIHGNSLQCLNLVTGGSVSAALAVTFSNSTVFCLIDADTVLSAGGKPSSTSAYCIRISTGETTPLPPMLVPRRLPGVLKHAGFVYLFGGSDGNKQLSSCEKLSIAEKAWKPLPDMGYPRGGFSPCLFGEDVYLADVKREHRMLETFSIPRQTFTPHPLSIPPSLSSNSVGFLFEGELVIFTVDKQIGRWRVNGEGGFRVAKVAMKDTASGLSNVPPVRVGREVVWARWKDGGVVRFNVDTETLTE